MGDPQCRISHHFLKESKEIGCGTTGEVVTWHFVVVDMDKRAIVVGELVVFLKLHKRMYVAVVMC